MVLVRLLGRGLKFLGQGCLWILLLLIYPIACIPWLLAIPTAEPGSSPSPGQSSPSATATAPAGSATPSAPPAQPAAVWRPGFKALPVGSWSDQTRASVLDYGDVDETSLKLANQVNAVRFPAHACRLGESTSLAILEQVSEQYANCLLDSWRPWLGQQGAREPDRITVHHCGRKERADETSCRKSDDFFGRATPDNLIYLAPSATPGRHGSLAIELVIAHEVGHNLQFQVRPKGGGERALTLGIADADHLRLSRRAELQVECMSVAMVAKSSKRSGVHQAAQGDVFGSDAEHWDRPRHLFWTKQALKDRVGECNANLATDDLVAYKGRG